jgi:hypothetical protein
MLRVRPSASRFFVALAAAWTLASHDQAAGNSPAAVAAERVAPPALPHAGTLRLPDAVGDIAITGLSGVTFLGDDRYAAVLDNSDRLLLFRLWLSSAGVPERVGDLKIVTLAATHDYEDIAPCPPRLAARIADRRRNRGDRVPDRCLLVCEEDTPAIRAIDLDRGDLLGIVPIPEIFATRRPNRGLEALATDPDGRVIWTATEEAVPADGPAAGENRGTVVRIARIAVPGGDVGDRDAQFAYAVAPPHRFARVFAGDPLSGLVALVALDGARLLALERSGAPGLPPFTSRITLIDTAAGRDVSDLPGDLAERPDLRLATQPLWHDSLGCNLEGLCLGPQLTAGRRVLVGVADNGGLGTPNQLVTFVLTEPRATLDATAAGLAAGLAGAALLLVRLTSPSPCWTR